MKKEDKKWLLKRKLSFIECVIGYIIIFYVFINKVLFFDVIFILKFFYFAILLFLIVTLYELVILPLLKKRK